MRKEAPRKGPVAEVGWIETGRGEVKYSAEGFGFVVAGRRRAALRKASKLCLGMPYVIDDEFTREDVETPYFQDDLEDNLDRGVKHYVVAPFHHILFECRPPEEKKK